LSVENRLNRAVRVKRKYEKYLLSISGVVGVGVGGSRDNPRIIINVKEINEDVRKIPKELDGVDVEIRVTGEVMVF